jgi:hypothetical protein
MTPSKPCVRLVGGKIVDVEKLVRDVLRRMRRRKAAARKTARSHRKGAR